MKNDQIINDVPIDNMWYEDDTCKYDKSTDKWHNTVTRY